MLRIAKKIKAHIFQHVPFENIGTIADWLQQRNIPYKQTCFYRTDYHFPDINDFDFLIIMGGLMSVHDVEKYPFLTEEKLYIQKALEADKYILGICLGAQLIAEALGAKVTKNPQKEIGWFPVIWEEKSQKHPLVTNIANGLNVFHWHGETFSLPEQAMHLGRTTACNNQGFLWGGKVLGLQFHLEITEDGILELVENCEHELKGPSSYIQDKKTIIDQMHRCTAANLAMNRLLDVFLGFGGKEIADSLNVMDFINTKKFFHG